MAMAESLSNRARNVSGGLLLSGALGVTGLLHVNERNYNIEVEKRVAAADVNGNIMPLIKTGEVPSKDTLVDGLEINSDRVKDITPTGNVISATTGTEVSLDASEDLKVKGFKNRWKFAPLGAAVAIIGIRAALRRKKNSDSDTYTSPLFTTLNRTYSALRTSSSTSEAGIPQLFLRESLIERWEKQQLSQREHEELDADIAALKAQAAPLINKLDRHRFYARTVNHKRDQYNQLVQAAEEALAVYNQSLTQLQASQAEVSNSRESFVSKLGDELTISQAEAILGLDLHSDRRPDTPDEQQTQPGNITVQSQIPAYSQYDHLRSAFDTAVQPITIKKDTENL